MHKHPTSSVASLPIRNWNQPRNHIACTRHKSCEPTYKELKQEIQKEALKGKLIRCEPTYKELKLFNCFGLWVVEWLCCEPTYKELKLNAEIMSQGGIVRFEMDRSCEPTYKELKLNAEIMSHYTGLQLRAYL